VRKRPRHADASEECNFLHRLPRPNEIANQGTDVFGREKFGGYRDDMGGVGSMLHVNRTLYVGRINEETSLSFRRAAANPNDGQDDSGETPMAKIVRRHFSEWGELDHGSLPTRPELTAVRVKIGRGVAFVTYKYEANAQFAKEAMMHQSLDHDEVLNVRWSTEDPRSDGQARDEAERREQGERHIADAEHLRQELERDYEALKGDPSIDWEDYRRAKRQRLALGEDEARRLDEENQRGWEELQAAKRSETKAAPKAAPRPESRPVLSDEAIKSLAMLRQTKPAPPSALGGLQTYASSDEE